MKSVYWHQEDNAFFFPKHLERIHSPFGKIIAEAVKDLDNGLQVFLRGSLLEAEHPFIYADADLFVLYDNHKQLEQLSICLPFYKFYDIKLIHQTSLGTDYVYEALLHCRSLQISGDTFVRKPVMADKKFAWEHWIKYCPATIPNQINTGTNVALIYFKLLTRCFGVLSFLKNKSFTRDIAECINIAHCEDKISSKLLTEIRECLETKMSKTFQITDCKKLLIKKFDEYYNYW